MILPTLLLPPQDNRKAKFCKSSNRSLGCARSFAPVTASSVTITGVGTAEQADVMNPGAREIQFLEQ